MIYEDAWVLTLPQFKVHSTIHAESLYSHVCDLLNKRGNWDDHKLSDCFRNEECREIMKTPTAACLDALIWHYNKCGQFIVKNAYFLAYKYVHGLDLSKGYFSVSFAKWKHLWKLKLPLTVKVFLWRAFLNKLPTLYNLSAKGIVNNDLCQNC